MKKIRREDTDPEQSVRQLLWDAGGRYRLNVSDLPGSPDIANKSKEKAIFVHGCFWHHHEDCAKASLPKSNRSYWKQKFRKNKKRDARKIDSLQERGFDVLVVWECELDDPGKVKDRLNEFWFD